MCRVNPNQTVRQSEPWDELQACSGGVVFGALTAANTPKAG